MSTHFGCHMYDLNFLPSTHVFLLNTILYSLPNVDVHPCLTPPLPPMSARVLFPLTPSPLPPPCGRLLWMTP